jgi:hypothetical protein
MSNMMSPKEMSAQDLFAWGAENVAYVARVEANGSIAYAIHSADGTRLAIAPSRDLAFAAAKQHELEVVSVH